ncbi:hypothetical protein PV10_05918 [Exophiala mesophila]|uniref:Uncharacterized protein n=1 Tax=Exophiala mesophila TaxID=212818 RepID=A0A0D1ZX26_EXOME|nr:uncharacterized protein PV10_05918 [Exophiala mesophila]KIV91373.1 hypothetical protein PV10_05918 [Exophiala mesophila]
MQFQRMTSSTSPAADSRGIEARPKGAQIADGDKPLTCMFFFFASQMKHNLQAADPDLVRRGRMLDRPTHKLNSMIDRIGMHASYSPLIAKFETYPVEIPEPRAGPRPKQRLSREEAHDTIMMIKFRDKRAREDWIATKEWQEFVQSTDSERVFRRMPHVRCASSLRGLMDPVDSLLA